MSKGQMNSSFYEGRYLQLLDEKTRNRDKVSTSSTEHLLHYDSNSPQKQNQKPNFETQSLSIEEQLKKMATNHNRIMEMMEGTHQTSSWNSVQTISPKKYDNFNPEKYIDSQLLSGRKEKGIQKEIQEDGGVNQGVYKENFNTGNYQVHPFQLGDKVGSTKPKGENNSIKQSYQAQPRLNSSYNNSREDIGFFKTQTQYHHYNDPDSRMNPSSQTSFSRPHTQYIRMPQPFTQQFPKFFVPEHPGKQLGQFSIKPTSPELIINRPSIPRAPRSTLQSHKKINYSDSKPLIRERSNSREKKLSLSINTLNDLKNSNSSNQRNNTQQVRNTSGSHKVMETSIERKRRPSSGVGILVTLMRK